MLSVSASTAKAISAPNRVRKRLPKFYRRPKRGVLEKSVVDENLMRHPFILFVSFFDFLPADDVKFSVPIESDRKLNPRVTCAAAENRELLERQRPPVHPA